MNVKTNRDQGNTSFVGWLFLSPTEQIYLALHFLIFVNLGGIDHL